jgi:hypothetical protein
MQDELESLHAIYQLATGKRRRRILAVGLLLREARLEMVFGDGGGYAEGPRIFIEPQLCR